MRASDVTSSTLLREARKQAGLTQRQLADRAGVTQSVIAAYESGTREPALPTLAALVEAAGIILTIELGPRLPAGARHRAGPLGHRLFRNRAAIRALAAKHGATNLQVFGSVARGEDHRDSDIDLLVDLPPGAGLFALARLKSDLEALLHVRVDLVPSDGIKPRVRTNIDKDLVPL